MVKSGRRRRRYITTPRPFYLYYYAMLYTKYTHTRTNIMYLCVCVRGGVVYFYRHRRLHRQPTSPAILYRTEVFLWWYGEGAMGGAKTCIYKRPRGRYRRTRGFVKPGLSTRDRCAVNSKRIKLFAWGFVLFFLFFNISLYLVVQ